MVKNTTSEQALPKKRKVTNPKGKGGFQDHPELINAGGRPKNIQRYDYWLQFFKDMSVADFKEYIKKRTDKEMYVAEAQAYQRIGDSLKDLKTWQVVAERTEGKAPATVDITSGGESFGPLVVEILHVTKQDANTRGV